MNSAKTNAYAKLNLTLDITGREGGYHTLDSLVVTVDLCDKIVVKKRRDNLIGVTMHGMKSEAIPPEENNAQKAGERFVERFHTTGANITVYKNIPLCAGLGGSSADAAGVISALARLYEIDDAPALKALADGLGSDTGYLLSGGAARLRGRGEQVQPLDLPEMHFLVACPATGVSTPACYRKYDELAISEAPRTDRAFELLSGGNFEWAAKLLGNALYPAARALNPDVYETLLALKELSPWAAGMTGSGSACYALFPTQELCEWAKSRYRGKGRVYAVKSVNPAARKSVRNPFVIEGSEIK